MKLLNDELNAIYQEMATIVDVAPMVMLPRQQTDAIRSIADAVKTLAWHCDKLRSDLETHEETQSGVHGK